MSPIRTSRRRWRSSIAIALLLAGGSASAETVAYDIKPSLADPRVQAFDVPSIALTDDKLPPNAPLVLFLSGTGGKPDNAVGLLRTIAGQGYRVISLAYNNEPAVVQVCTRDPDRDCAAAFREMRISGTGASTKVSNPIAEAIIPRLVAALRVLAREHPEQGWGGYLDGDQPRWSNIVVSGLSQGAGMAAFIAKQHAVRRVVLFSSPWETTGADRRPAPWIGKPGATPVDRWWAAYNVREKTATLIEAAYAQLALPADHIVQFKLDLPTGVRFTGENPYHAIGIRDPRYTPQWKQLFGRGG